MKKYDIHNLIDINKRRGFPRTYRFNPFIRWFVITLSLFAIFYAVYYITTSIDSTSKTFHKIVPFVIIFFALNSLSRNFIYLNSIRFEDEMIKFRYLGKPTVAIRWGQFKKISLHTDKTRSIKIDYDNNGVDKSLIFTLNFPNLLEVMNAIAEMCPDLEYDDFMKSVILSDTEKEELKGRESKE